MSNTVYERSKIKDKILSGLDFITKPVVSTLSPKGHNVLIQGPGGILNITNDGVTVAKAIDPKDPIENAVVSLVKEGSKKTNSEAGDGTTTTVALIDVLSREGLKLVEDGYSWIHVRDEFDKFASELIKAGEKQKIEVKGMTGLKDIAFTSANNDPEIAKYVIEAVSVAQTDGVIFLDSNPKHNVTEITKDLGFMVKSGVMYQELMTGGQQVAFTNAPVIITDKKLYYGEEAETILSAALKAGHKAVVVVARDFMGEALNTFIANHQKGVIQVMLVQEPSIGDKNNPILYDLAAYINATKVFTEKTGSLVNKIEAKDFTMVSRVISDPMKTLFTPVTSASKELKVRIQDIRNELEKDKENGDLKARLASLTTGVVTIKVGASTPLELREKVYRYEDAINATRAAMKYGYLPGGGTSLLRAYSASEGHCRAEFRPAFKRYGEAILRQIALNCGKHPDTIIDEVKRGKGSYGYNALTDKFEDLTRAGVVDPFQVFKMSILNSVSVAKNIISINNYLINDKEEDEAGTSKSSRD